MLADAHSLGYNSKVGLIDSLAYGVPQRRKRIYLAGVLAMPAQNLVLEIPRHGRAWSRT